MQKTFQNYDYYFLCILLNYVDLISTNKEVLTNFSCEVSSCYLGFESSSCQKIRHIFPQVSKVLSLISFLHNISTPSDNHPYHLKSCSPHLIQTSVFVPKQRWNIYLKLVIPIYVLKAYLLNYSQRKQNDISVGGLHRTSKQSVMSINFIGT